MTAAPPKAAPKTEEPAPEPEPQPEPPKQDTTPPPDQTPPLPPPEPLPPPPPPKPAPAPPPVTPPPPPKPQPPKPKQKDDMASLEKLLKDMQKQQPKPASPQAPTPDTSVNNQAPSISDRATMTELDAIRHHFESCFRIDPGMEGIENMSVEIRVHIGLDGSVQNAEFTDITRYLDPTQPSQFRTFANNVRISVLGCSGVPITADHYEQLKTMDLTFSPQGRIN
jgi:outer membrane biosynthesis protein TonB